MMGTLVVPMTDTLDQMKGVFVVPMMNALVPMMGTLPSMTDTFVVLTTDRIPSIADTLVPMMGAFPPMTGTSVSMNDPFVVPMMCCDNLHDDDASGDVVDVLVASNTRGSMHFDDAFARTALV